MKKWIWISLSAAVVAAALTTGLVIHHRNETAAAAALALEQSLSRAAAIHEAAYDQYQEALEMLDQSSLTVTEGDRLIGVYSLEDLGLADSAKAAIESTFDAVDLLTPESFSELTQEAQLDQLNRTISRPDIVPLELERLDFVTVLQDLEAVPRRPSTDCAPYFTGSRFVFRPEKTGTELDESRVLDALNSCMENQVLSDEPLTLVIDIQDCDPYLPPTVTLENQQYDLDALLRDILNKKDYCLHVDLWGTDVVLDADQCADLLRVQEDGSLRVDRDLVAARISDWAAIYDADRVPYCFKSFSAGKVALSFLTVNCRLNQAALLNQLDTALCQLSTGIVDAPFDCTDWAGRPFSISGTYIEVDIARQTMSCFKDDVLVVSTPVVSGLSWNHMTPSGYYRVQSKAPNQWLTGPDYTVFVYYWLGFYGAYGIHDAKWRSIFGGSQYINNGSHGCVNTPSDAMVQIYNSVEIGTPVVIFNIPGG